MAVGRFVSLAAAMIARLRSGCMVLALALGELRAGFPSTAFADLAIRRGLANK